MPGLQRGVLAVVAEGQQLARLIGDFFRREAQQLPQHRQAQGGGGRAAALGIQPAELAKLTAPHPVLHPAGWAETEAAFQEPAGQPITAGRAIGAEAAGHRRKLPIGAFQHQLIVAVRLQPAVGEVGFFQVVDAVVPSGIRHEVPIHHIPLAQAGFIRELAGIDLNRDPVVQMSPDGVKLLPAAAAEHHRIQERLPARIGLILLRLQ